MECDYEFEMKNPNLYIELATSITVESGYLTQEDDSFILIENSDTLIY